MMSKQLHNFFEAFGTEKPGIDLPASNTVEQNARIWAEHHNNIVEPGHGLFIDFKQTPEFEKPCIDYITKHFGWTLEKPYFIRKPKDLD